MGNNVKSSASALGTRSVQRRPLLIAEQGDEVGLPRAQMNSAQVQRAPAVPVGKQAKVPNLHETSGEDVKKEAPDELSSIECHRAAAVVVPRIAPAEAHSSVLDSEQPSVGDSDPMRLAGQILRHMFRAPERRLGVDHPLLASDASEQRVEGLRRRECNQLAGEA